MKISIAERIHPFSHRPGVQCLLPLSTWKAVVYPTRLVLQKMDDLSQVASFDLKIEGPLSEFTVEMDLEKGVLRVFGRAKHGFLRYEVSRSSEGILLTFEKIPSAVIEVFWLEKKKIEEVVEKGSLVIPLQKEAFPVTVPKVRLSLGMHKAQDWDLVLRRFDLKEILPVVMRLGSMIPATSNLDRFCGTFKLLDAFQKASAAHCKLEAYEACRRWLQASFTGILVPTLTDTLFQGILPDCEAAPDSFVSLFHLSLGYRAVLDLFFQEGASQWEILPCLLPAFASGRLVHLSTQGQETLSIEWSKHQLSKMIVQTRQARRQALKFPKEIRSFRVRANLKEKGRVLSVDAGCAQLDLPESSQLFLDRFQK